ncbi:MAG: response regulator [Pseudomonadota bacterium]
MTDQKEPPRKAEKSTREKTLQPPGEFEALSPEEARRTRNELRIALEKYQVLFEAFPLGVSITDAAGNIIETNRESERLLGLLKNEHVKRQQDGPEWRIIRPDGTPMPSSEYAGVRALREKRLVENVEMGLVKDDGKVTWMSVTAAPIPLEGFGAAITYGDITQRKKAEDELRESEKRYRKAQAVGRVGSWEYNIQTARFWGSDEAKRIYGFSRAEDTFSTDEVEHCIPERERVHQALIDLLEDDKEYNLEFEIITKDAKTRKTIISLADLERDEAGRPLKITGVIVDITDRKRAEEEKEKLQEQLRNAHKMEAIGTLASGIAHEFNNLLQAMTGYTQLLLMDKSPDDSDYPSLLAIQNSGNRAADLVRQLLQFSRKAGAQRRPVDLGQEVKQARQLLERTIPRMIQINIRSAGDPWTINADPIQIEQILLNLGTNAADAMPDGGELVIETENAVLNEDDADRRLDAPPGRYVLLTVSDTGYGMDQELVKHIFDPFFTTKEIGKGTGLGLASVYGIVRSHGGSITCHSKVGRGTKFKIYFPAIDRPEARDAAPNHPRGGGETILVVDDEEAITGFVQQVLERFGYKVLTAAGGEEALEVYSNQPGAIDLIIMDLGMPGMGGRQCLQALRRMNCAARVVIASGYSMDNQVPKSSEAGADGYLSKPYQLNDLLSKLREILD